MNDPKDKSEPFLSRWARRKQDVARGRIDESAPATAKPGDDPETIDAASLSDAQKEPELDLSTLPKAEDLTAESDITVFLDKRVPALLRNAALGRMWTLDPTIRDFIEVAENQWNWNVPGGAPFYEPMEAVVESAGEIVAQAGNLSGTTIAQTFEAPDGVASKEATLVRADSPGIELKNETRKIEPPENPAAPQYGSSTSENSLAVAATIDDACGSGASSAVVDDIALQHRLAQSLVNRRRHGGALPG